jgi:hypothetical protein
MTLSVRLGPSGTMEVHLPSENSPRGSHVQIPLTLDGLRLLRHILIERQRDHIHRVGRANTPTQQMVHQWLAQAKAEARETAKVEASRNIEALVPGLDLSSLTL